MACAGSSASSPGRVAHRGERQRADHHTVDLDLNGRPAASQHDLGDLLCPDAIRFATHAERASSAGRSRRPGSRRFLMGLAKVPDTLDGRFELDLPAMRFSIFIG